MAGAVPRWVSVALIPAVNLVAALFLAGLIVLIVGESPWIALRALVLGAFGSWDQFGYTLFYTTSFIFTGLAVASAFHCGLFNIGGEGQAMLGGLGVALACLAFDGLPWFLLLPLAVGAAAVFGGAWAFLPGYLQATRGSHTVITTIMFNFLAAILLNYLLVEVLIAPGQQSPQTIRFDETGFPVNRMFADVPQDEPVVELEPGFENEVGAFNLYAYLSRSDVTWTPSVCSVVHESLFCPTSEEYILPVEHGNDRVEWFVQLSDEIIWDVRDKQTGRARAKVTMRAGDVAAMPADIRHQGYAPKRAMLLVWENASLKIPELIQKGEAPVVPVEF